MLSDEKLKLIKELAASFNTEELLWSSGYLAGKAHKAEAIAEPALQPVAKKFTLAYGTETGNAKKLATQLAGIAKSKGAVVKLAGLDQYKLERLPKEENFFIITSTQGDGEPPALAKKFYEQLHDQSLNLKNVKFAVLGLGDTSYAEFCKTAEDMDLRLEALGGVRLLPLQKCDTDYEQDAMDWLGKVLASLETGAVPAFQPDVIKKQGAGKKYYAGKVTTSINLNDRGSNKETYHIEITTEDDIDYLPGDALGIVPPNKQVMIDNILAMSGINAGMVISTKTKSGTVQDLLTVHLNICYLLQATVKNYAAITGHDIPQVRMSLYDLMRRYPVKDTTQFLEVLQILTPQAPRLYSIASSPAAHGNNEVHITVSKNRFNAEEQEQYGLCSAFLSDVAEGQHIHFYIHHAKHFKLPAPDKDIIMIGPGTGIAPFRSFIAERDASGATGRNWLFFGEQHFITDFLYQAELQNYLLTGALQKLDLAFSRDTKEKIYVQHRIQQKGAEVVQWLNDGASLYVCGAKNPMSKDVEAALVQALAAHDNKTPEAAQEYIDQLINDGRYAKDVY